MKLANLSQRAVLVIDDQVVDVATESDGRFGPDLMAVYDNWTEFTAWAGTFETGTFEKSTVAKGAAPLDRTQLGNPAPTPRQVFGIGLNYSEHAAESGMDVPTIPATFTKFPASLSGPSDDIEIVGTTVDWEAELVAVIGVRADRVDVSNGWDHVAGLAVGQDISDRTLQFAAGNQFSLGKSRRGYGPIGPWLMTPDEFDNPDDLALGCSINGDVKQQSRTSDLIFGVSQLVAELSAILPLLPGDVIFTGTPAGVGLARNPPEFLQPGDVVETWVEGIGSIRNQCVQATR